MGLTFRSERSEASAAPPGEAARKRAAVELIRNHDRVLRASARRYSLCGDDAEDAYQRGIEILLSKAPTAEMRQLVPWARTVIKHESLAIRKARERSLGRPEQATIAGEDGDWVQLIPSVSDGPDEQVAVREKVARSREALGLLKPAELKALTLLAEGYSYAEIGAMNNWTRTKVNRCLAEGRQRFRSIFSESEAGERCERFEPLLSACCDGELDRARLTELENHLAACGHCRATLRTYRAAPRAAAALAPLLPGSHTVWERIQEFAVSVQARFMGAGSDAAGPGVLASGGTRGAGTAVLAKVAAVCVGTAGGAAACVAVGVLPAPDLIPNREPKPPVVRPDRAAKVPSRPPAMVPEPVAIQPDAAPTEAGSTRPQERDQSEGSSRNQPNRDQAPAPAPVPPPTPTETEFTPEAAGVPVSPAAAPPPPAPKPAPRSSGSIPVGGGGGEFGP